MNLTKYRKPFIIRSQLLSIEKGIVKGERCYRKGCEGIIDEYEKEGGCGCPTGHPPCGYCTSDTSYCPECEWDCRDY